MRTGIAISKMTGKLEGIPALNTNSLTCAFRLKLRKKNEKKYVCDYCYSRQMLKGIRKSCVKAWQNNSDILSGCILPESILPVFNSKFVRLSAHGELINDIHYQNYINIMKLNKNTMFALWTKRKDIVKKYPKVKNCIYIYSSICINEMKDDCFFDKIFTVYDKNYAKENNININCSGKRCIECQLCYTKNKTRYINELVKNCNGVPLA